MPVAYRITEQIPGKAGEAYGYELSEPYSGADYLIVSRIDWAAFGLRETRIAPGQLLDGQVITQTGVDNSLALSIPFPLCTHAEALAEIGYEIGEKPPVEETPPGDPDVKVEPTAEVEP
ncbi:hypothetical protein [Rhodococcus sp. B10]|uniref:hypothetical protein n=1 Tax=Rhodococcus sp. B10 TaxID=2695876 RepID=UPI001430334D|nr:hypothetical protein [Rhodococcus sp. B10]NIL77594.1 hypothetical protein [Rhodococcus sp. B10]